MTSGRGDQRTRARGARDARRERGGRPADERRPAGERDDRDAEIDEEEEDDTARERYRDEGDTGGLSVAEAADAALDEITRLTGKEAEGVTSVVPATDGWTIGVELLEANRIPSSSDTLALYEVEIDMTGGLTSYRRLRRYPRGRTDESGEA